MDKSETRKELTDDMTRESLIAISYGLPEFDPAADEPKNVDNEIYADQPLCSVKDETFRSELISISYASPLE